jgi:hypothetical protein
VKNNRPTANQPVLDPGKGKRTPTVWGRWLLDRMGFQRQVLQALQTRPMYQGTANAKAVAKRRAKNKMASRSRRINRMHG